MLLAALLSFYLRLLAPFATAIVVNDIELSLEQPGLGETNAVSPDGLKSGLDGSNIHITNNPSPFIVGSKKISPGAVPVILAGATYSVDRAGSAIFVNGVPSPLPSPNGQPLRHMPVIKICEQGYTTNAHE